MRIVRPVILIIFSFLASALLISCGGGGFQKSPLDEIIQNIPRDEMFTIILNDMNAEGNFSKSYFHKYQIIRDNQINDAREVVSDWHGVREKEFNNYINDMGMEIASRDSTGKLTKTVAPPGYNNYVGNQKYGRWENRGGSSFWAFYGQYAFMSSMLRMSSYPVSRGYYRDWRGNYAGTNRRYYGPSSGGRSYYGTNSAYNNSRNSRSTWGSKSTSFKNNVTSRTSRSSGSFGSSRSSGGGYGK